MNYSKIILSLFFMVPSTAFALSEPAPAAPSPVSDLQGYLADTNAENSNYLDAIKKAGNDQAKISKVSKKHAKSLQAINKKHHAGMHEYFTSTYQQDDAKRQAWQKAEAILKKQYEAELGNYWKQSKAIETAFSDSMKALHAEYGAPLKKYQAANRALIQKYW